MSIDRLERAQPGRRFRASVGEGVLSFPSPADLTVEELSAIYQTDGLFLIHLAAPEERGITIPAVRAIFDAWADHHDLPEEDEFRRLLWMVDRYADAIEVDLSWRGHDLVALWKERRLRHLLLLVDALPTASHTKEALHTDVEYAETVRKAQEARKKAGEKDDPRAGLPPLREHTPEVALLTKLVDAVRSLNRTLIAVNMTRGTPPKFEPEPRPWTAHKIAAEEDRRQASEKLAARVLTAKPPPGAG